MGHPFSSGYNSRQVYAVAPDGRFLMDIVAEDASTSPINVVLNWDRLIQR